MSTKRSRLPNPLDTINDPVMRLLKTDGAPAPTAGTDEISTTVARALQPPTPAPPLRAVSPAANASAGDSSLREMGTDFQLRSDLLNSQLDSLREEALLIEKLDPKRVRPTRFCNRHELTLLETDPAFIELRESIETNGQDQPIRVRALEPPVDGYEYEIVSGHRRHRVCLLLKRPVLARVDTQIRTSKDLALKMYRENEQRLELYPIEKARMFQQWLAEGIFPSANQIAESVGVDRATVGRYLALTSLPEAVLRCFPDERQIALRWVDPLRAALKVSPEEACTVARRLAAELISTSSSTNETPGSSVGGSPPKPSRKKASKSTDDRRSILVGSTVPVKVSAGKTHINFKGTRILEPAVNAEFNEAMYTFAKSWLQKRLGAAQVDEAEGPL